MFGGGQNQNNSFGGGSSFGASNNLPKPTFGGFGTTTSQPSGGAFGGGGLFGQNTTNTSTGGELLLFMFDKENRVTTYVTLVLKLWHSLWNILRVRESNTPVCLQYSWVNYFIRSRRPFWTDPDLNVWTDEHSVWSASNQHLRSECQHLVWSLLSF